MVKVKYQQKEKKNMVNRALKVYLLLSCVYGEACFKDARGKFSLLPFGVYAFLALILTGGCWERPSSLCSGERRLTSKLAVWAMFWHADEATGTGLF